MEAPKKEEKKQQKIASFRRSFPKQHANEHSAGENERLKEQNYQKALELADSGLF